ncbi:MAG: hypothetical protein AAGA29_05340 [Planctomycetota bacterium]
MKMYSGLFFLICSLLVFGCVGQSQDTHAQPPVPYEQSSVPLLYDANGQVIGNPSLYWFDHFVYPDGTFTRDEIIDHIRVALSYSVGTHRQVAADIFSWLLLDDRSLKLLIERDDFEDLLVLAVKDPMPARRIGFGSYRQGERVHSRVDTVGINYGLDAHHRPIEIPLGMRFEVRIHTATIYPYDEPDSVESLDAEWFMHWFESGRVTVDRKRLRERFVPGEYVLRLVYQIEIRESFRSEAPEPQVLAQVPHQVPVTLYGEE